MLQYDGRKSWGQAAEFKEGFEKNEHACSEKNEHACSEKGMILVSD